MGKKIIENDEYYSSPGVQARVEYDFIKESKSDKKFLSLEEALKLAKELAEARKNKAA